MKSSILALTILSISHSSMGASVTNMVDWFNKYERGKNQVVNYECLHKTVYRNESGEWTEIHGSSSGKSSINWSEEGLRSIRSSSATFYPRRSLFEDKIEVEYVPLSNGNLLHKVIGELSLQPESGEEIKEKYTLEDEYKYEEGVISLVSSIYNGKEDNISKEETVYFKDPFQTKWSIAKKNSFTEKDENGVDKKTTQYKNCSYFIEGVKDYSELIPSIIIGKWRGHFSTESVSISSLNFKSSKDIEVELNDGSIVKGSYLITKNRLDLLLENSKKILKLDIEFEDRGEFSILKKEGSSQYINFSLFKKISDDEVN
ncbi:hypothetical protein [Halobacteriovorax sp. JY17]|uniref:hypothetical protein n=1 Tax=Halobacteriovorax sp. JY17 TaxID=2014617 RepID=UPI000C6B8E31|nr:hypothetical protein [Halobacteriovorax sp. JY17]PIK15920.1 MAG: hypothetical protein CES88_04115 [Halobacteriovorax sp. JY17]